MRKFPENALYKYYIISFFFVFGLLVTLYFGFVSCAPPQLGEDRGSEGIDQIVIEDEDDKEEGCREHDTCEELCERIYNESWQACSRESSETITRLQRVYNRLKSARANRSKFDEISEERGGITLADFEKYLNIGVDGWLKQIEGDGVDAYNQDQAEDAIDWLIEEQKIAAALSSTSEGADILKPLLEIANNGDDCFWESNSSSNPVPRSMDQNIIFALVEGDEIKISSLNPSKAISVEIEEDLDLYDLLSCLEVNGSTGERSDIFSLAADESNEALFGLAFDLLDEVCRDSSLDSRQSQRVAICRRAMMCVLAINYYGTTETSGAKTVVNASRTNVAKWDGWDYAQDRFSESGRGFDEDEACDMSSNEFGGTIRIK